MSIVSYDAVFGAALTQQSVPPLPEESCRLNRLPNDPLINVLNYLPDEDVLQLLRVCPNDPELQEIGEASSSREFMRNSVLPELVNSTRYRNGLEKLKAADARGDLVEGLVSGIAGGIAGPSLLGISTGLGIMNVLTGMVVNGERYEEPLYDIPSLSLFYGMGATTPNSLRDSYIDIHAAAFIEVISRLMPKHNMKIRLAALYITARTYQVAQQNGGIRTMLGTTGGRFILIRTHLTASLALNSVFKIQSSSVQGLVSMGVAGVAARLISNCSLERYLDVDVGEIQELARVFGTFLSTLAGILTIK